MAVNRKNLAAGILANSPGVSGTNWLLETGYGQTMPDVPFKMTTTPPGQLSTMGNSEIVNVTARSVDALTVVRAQGGTAAQNVQAGWPVANGIYVEDMPGTNSIVSDETPTGTVNGINKLFTTSQKYVPNSLQLFIRGVKQARGVHFVETDPATGKFTVSDAPITGDNMLVTYQFAEFGTNNADTVDGFHAASTPTANTLLPLDSDGKVPSGSSRNDAYSMSEVDTGKKWVDGRTVFRKVVRTPINVVAGPMSIPHGIVGLTAAYSLVSSGGQIKLGSSDGNGTGGQFLSYREAGGNWINLSGITTLGVELISSYNWGPSFLTLVLEYIK